MTAEMKLFTVIATILLHQQAVGCQNDHETLHLSPPNDTLVETGNSLSCFEMKECIKACLNNTADIQENAQDEIIPMDDVINATVSECGEGIWYRIAHLNMTNPTETCPSVWNQYTAPVRACGRKKLVSFNL